MALTRQHTERPWWPAHEDDDVWYCDAHNTFDCGPCQRTPGAPAQERRVLRAGWRVLRGGEAVDAWYTSRKEAEWFSGVWAKASGFSYEVVYCELAVVAAPLSEGEQT